MTYYYYIYGIITAFITLNLHNSLDYFISKIGIIPYINYLRGSRRYYLNVIPFDF